MTSCVQTQYHLDNPVPNSRITFTSPDIQNKVIEISGEIVHVGVKTCNYFEYFGLIGDEATDVSTYEQVSVCVRFVECSGGKVILREEFPGFVSASETTGKILILLRCFN